MRSGEDDRFLPEFSTDVLMAQDISDPGIRPAIMAIGWDLATVGVRLVLDSDLPCAGGNHRQRDFRQER